MEPLVTGLIVAAIGALTYVAYRHPEAYKKRLYIPLIVAGTCVFTGINIWDAALATADIAIINSFPVQEWVKIEKVIDSRQASQWLSFIIWLVAQAYLYLLCHLDNLLGKNGSE